MSYIPQKRITRRITFDDDIPKESYTMPKYVKQLIACQNASEENQQKSGKLVDKTEYISINKAVLAVLTARIKVRKAAANKAEEVNRKIQRKLEEVIESLVTENVRNRLKFKTTQISGYQAKYEGTSSAIRKLLRIHEDMKTE